jgi:hypothetical protein
MKNSAIATARSHGHSLSSAQHRLSQQISRLVPLDGAETEPDFPFEEGVHDTIDPDMRHRLISAAAFDLYAKRGYVDGHDQEDWYAAEALVDHQMVPRASQE